MIYGEGDSTAEVAGAILRQTTDRLEAGTDGLAFDAIAAVLNAETLLAQLKAVRDSDSDRTAQRYLHPDGDV